MSWGKARFADVFGRRPLPRASAFDLRQRRRVLERLRTPPPPPRLWRNGPRRLKQQEIVGLDAPTVVIDLRMPTGAKLAWRHKLTQPSCMLFRPCRHSITCFSHALFGIARSVGSGVRGLATGSQCVYSGARLIASTAALRFRRRRAVASTRVSGCGPEAAAGAASTCATGRAEPAAAGPGSETGRATWIATGRWL